MISGRRRRSEENENSRREHTYGIVTRVRRTLRRHTLDGVAEVFEDGAARGCICALSEGRFRYRRTRYEMHTGGRDSRELHRFSDFGAKADQSDVAGQVVRLCAVEEGREELFDSLDALEAACARAHDQQSRELQSESGCCSY